MGNLGNDKRKLLNKINGSSNNVKRSESKPTPKTATKKRGCGCKRNKK